VTLLRGLWASQITVLLGCLLFAPPSARASFQIQTEESLRKLLDSEPDPARKVRHLTRLADMLFDKLRRETSSGKYEDALKTLERYRDDVKIVHLGFKSSGRNAERKPAGFKQLQIHLRRSLRELGQIIFALPQDLKQFFEPIEAELAAMDKELLDALFPRGPAQKSGKEPPRPGAK